jgi:hypothetical protein
MNESHQTLGVTRFKDGFRWPYSVVICFLASTACLILFEHECIEYLRLILKNHIHLPHPWFYPTLTFALWVWSVWGLWKVRSTHDRIDKDVTRLMEYIAGMPVLSYLLAWHWSELVLTASKIK